MWILKKQYDLFNLYRQENVESIYKMANLRRELRVERERIETMQEQAEAANKLVRDVANELDRTYMCWYSLRDPYANKKAHDPEFRKELLGVVEQRMARLRELEAERSKTRLQSNLKTACTSVYATPPSVTCPKTIEQRVAELEAKEAKRAKRKK